MSDKHYVGRDLTGFEDNGKTRPVSRVTLMIDDENGVTAGDDTGLEITSTCPHATQAMADAILAKMKGYQYQMYTADAARLDPAAELGDGITADGVYGVISRLSDDGGGYPDITGPGEAELEDEFPIGEGPMTKEINRKLGATRSYITKTATQIREEVKNEVEGLSSSFTVELQSITGRVDGLDGQFSEFKQTVEGISSTVSGLDGKYSKLEQTVDGFTVSGPGGSTLIKGSSIETGSIAAGSIKASQVQLSGAITWNDLADGIGDYIDEAYSNASSAVTAASAAASTASSAQRMVDSMTYTYDGRTYIDENMLRTSEIIASKLKGGTVYLLDSSAREIGTMALAYTTYGYGMELATEYGGIRLFSANNLWLGTPNVQNDTGAQVEGAFVQLDNNGAGSSYSATHATIHAYRVSIGEYIDSALVAVNTSVNLGTSAHPWGVVYAQNGSIQTSDRNKKHDIEPLPERYVDMVRMLEPRRYRMNEGTSGRYHTGFIAQDVWAAMQACGIDNTEFGGYVADVDEDGLPVYMLRYDEFIGILLAYAKQLDSRINALEGA